MKNTLLKLVFFVLIVGVESFAQVGIGTTTPDAEAILDIQSSDKGLLIPRLADHTSITPTNGSDYGLLVFDTTTKSFWYWDGAIWSEVWSTTGSNAWELTGNSGTTAGTNYLGTTDNQDVIIARNATEELRILTDQVSINDTTPYVGDRFTVVGDTDEYAINGYGSGASGVGVYGSASYGVIGNGNVGIYGLSNGSTNFGVQCENNDTSGTALFAIGNNAAGVYLTDGSGIASTGTDTGIFTYATNTDGTGIIGVGNNTSIFTITGGSGGAFSGTRYGTVAFVSEDNNNTTAVYGRFTGATNTDAKGVLGYAVPASYYGFGVVGYGGYVGVYGDGGSYYGLYSNGDTYIDGDIDITGDQNVAGTKSFLIDHPLDPENKYLKHFSIESNEVLNIYRGNVILDNKGEAIVELPDYFISINKNFSYNLTPIGQSASSLFIKKEIDNKGVFYISGGTEGLKVSWTVYAERNDPYLQVNPQKREVEIEKDNFEKGKYINPELFNQLEEKQLNYDKVNKLQKSVQKKKIVTKRSIIKQPESKIKK